MILWANREDWHDLATYISFSLIVGLALTLLWFVYQGRNWARWLLAAIVAFHTLLAAGALHGMGEIPAGQFWFLALRALLQIAATILLFSRPASQWYITPARLAPPSSTSPSPP
jgi:hypothetical protein